MSNVVAIAGAIVPGVPDIDTIAEIERLLSQAKAGEVVAIAHATVLANGNTRSGWAGGASIIPLGFSIGNLMHRFFTGVNE